MCLAARCLGILPQLLEAACHPLRLGHRLDSRIQKFAPATPAPPPPQNITVQVIGDAGLEPSESFTLTLSSLVNAAFADSSATGTILNDDATAGVEDATLPLEFALSNASPNPSRGSFRLSFDVPRSANVKLHVLDLQGRQVAVLAEGEYKPGRYAISRNGLAGRGALPAGMYFLRYHAGGQTFVRRLVVAR